MPDHVSVSLFYFLLQFCVEALNGMHGELVGFLPTPLFFRSAPLSTLVCSSPDPDTLF